MATPGAGAAQPLSPEAAEVLRRRTTREHLAASVINASSFANADPRALADALNDITASAGEVSLKTQGDVTGFILATVLSSMAPRPAGDTTPIAGRGLHSSTSQLNLSRFGHKITPKQPLIPRHTA